MSLNPAQHAAVLQLDRPLLVLAGAGSGKTRVIIEKIAHLVDEARFEPETVCAITFTNKAAREMRERAGRRLRRGRADSLVISTFHALGLKILQADAARVGRRRGFSIMNSDDSRRVLAGLVPGADAATVDRLRQRLSAAKQDGEGTAIALSADEAELLKAYDARLAAFNAVDFDDLIGLPLKILRETPAVRDHWRQQLRYLMVDEYQDTNLAQYRLLRELAQSPGLMVVGDDDQSIYGWRGADAGNLDRLASDHPDLEVVKLEENYRCRRRILRCANSLIAHNPHVHAKRLYSALPDGDRIMVRECDDAQAEAEAVAAEVRFLMSKHRAEPRECAVLFRGNHQSRPVERALKAAGLRYRLAGGTALTDRAEVRDLLAWLKLIVNPRDDAAFLRAIAAPRRAVGDTSIERLAAAARELGTPMLEAARRSGVASMLGGRPAAGLADFEQTIARLARSVSRTPPAEFVRAVVAASGLDAAAGHDAAGRGRRANLAEFASWFERPSGVAVPSFGQQLNAIEIDRTADDDSTDRVLLTSLHSAKGLEFRYVFIIGVNDGVLPHEASIDAGTIEEERRLFYVGITRAREQLFLSYPRRGRRHGSTLRLAPSPFLKELPEAELHRIGADADADAKRNQEHARVALDAIAAMLD